jgi:hypothetical protein
MDIINWLNITFGVKNEISAPIFVTIIVFITGFILQGIIKNIAIIYKQYLLRKTVRQILKTIIPKLKIKSLCISAFEKDLSIDSGSLKVHSIKMITNLDSLMSIGYMQIQQAFTSFPYGILKKRLIINSINKISSTIELVKFHETAYDDHFKSFSQELATKSKNFIDRFENFRAFVFLLMDKCYREQNNLIPSDRILADKIMAILEKWNSRKDRLGPFTKYTYFIAPALEVCNCSPKSKTVVDLYNLLIPLQEDYFSLNFVFFKQKKVLNFYATSYNKAYNDLSSRIVYINLKTFYFLMFHNIDIIKKIMPKCRLVRFMKRIR